MPAPPMPVFLALEEFQAGEWEADVHNYTHEVLLTLEW